MSPEFQQPRHPGSYVRQSVLPQGMSVTEAARRLGIGRPALSNFLNGNARLSPNMATRLERVFGANAEELHDLQARFDRQESLKAQSLAVPAPYTPPVLTIKALEISRWADDIRARDELPVLVRRLVHATNRNLTEVDFPGYSEAQRGGWDGQVEATAATPCVPAGRSGWELSCERGVTGKANKDYGARLSVPREERMTSTFVFLTPRRWTGKRKWLREKKRLNDWKDVRAYDASDLEQWLEQSAPTQVWFAERLGKSTEGYRLLDRFWEEWSSVTEPPLSRKLFAPAEKQHSASFRAWLQQAPERPFTIAASRQEGIAFLACLMNSVKEGTDNAAPCAILLDQTTSVDRVSSAAVGAFVAVASTQEVEVKLSGLYRRLHCVSIQPSTSATPMLREPDATIGLLPAEDLNEALAAMGKSPTEANRLATETARSLTVLRRRLARIHTSADPRILPFAMLGAWNSESPADRTIVSSLSGVENYDDVEDAVAELARDDDPLVWSIGDYRGVSSRIDALFATADYVTKRTLDRFFEVAQHALSERDPALDLAPDQRWMAAVHLKVRRHSDALRQGVGTTLVLLAEHGERLFGHRLGVAPQQRVSDLIRELLEPATPDRLLSLAADLPVCAEAAPETLLSFLERNEPTVLELLKPEGTDPHTARQPWTGLTWALERLAWSPSTFPRAARIMERLCTGKLVGSSGHTLFGPLVSLFRHWLPQTGAPIQDRIRVLEALTARNPDLGQRVCLALLPRPRDVALPNPPLEWRGSPSLMDSRVTREESDQMVQAVYRLLLSRRDHDERSLRRLLKRMRLLDPEARVQVWKRVRQWAKKADSDRAIAELADSVRDCWTDDETDKKRALEHLKPTDPLLRHKWLFQSWWPLRRDPETKGLSSEDRQGRTDALQAAALRELWELGGAGTLRELAEGCEFPYVVGRLAHRLSLNEGELASLVHSSLEPTPSDNLRRQRHQLLAGMVQWAEPSLVERLLDNHVSRDDEAARCHILRVMPFTPETWCRLESESEKVQMDYWAQVGAGRADDHSAATINEAVDRLMDAGRPAIAFRFVSDNPGVVETSRLIRLLHNLAETNDNPIPENSWLGRALDSLEKRPDVAADAMAQLEFTFLQGLLLSKHQIPNLERKLAESPVLFLQVLARVYGRDDDGSDPPEWHIPDPERSRAFGEACYKLLERVRRLPGGAESDTAETGPLRDWLSSTRTLCAQYGRAKIADRTIGEWLARCSATDGVARPGELVCDAIESTASRELDRGFVLGALAARGVSTRVPGEGGDQERALAATYRQMAREMSSRWPRVGGVLDGLADSYERDGTRWDTRVAVEDRLGPHF